MLIGSRKSGSEATADRITGEADLMPHFGSKETGIILAAEQDECLWTSTQFDTNGEGLAAIPQLKFILML
jgi:hypothetical protein